MKKITYKGQSKILIALCNLVNELVDAVGSADDFNALKSKVETNTSNISTNAGNIATNTSDISDLKSKVSTNTSNISNNSSDISSLQSSVNTNAGNIATNTSDISALKETVKGLLSTDDTFKWLKAMVYTNNYWAQLRDEMGNPVVDENGNSILGNWSYVER